MKNIIECPKCHHQIDVEQALVKKIEGELSGDFQEKFNQLNEEYKEKMEALTKKEKEQDTIIEEKLKIMQAELLNETKVKIQAEYSEQIKELKEEVEQKSGKIRELNKQEAALLKKQRELEEKESAIELETQKKIEEEREALTEKIREQEQEKTFMKMKEKEQLVASLNKKIEDLKRNVEQGSMQTQGEVMELELEAMLSSVFPFDLIAEVKKGALGADVLQTVRNSIGREVGIIAFESKRTKTFVDGWIDKIKSDMQIHKADIGVIVTEVMPKDLPHFGLKDGVWICNFHEAQGLAAVLRESLLRIGEAKSSQENKGDKMTLLYDYLTSNEFKQQIQAIVEGFGQMKLDLEREKRAMAKIWKAREKQIEKVTINTIDMYGSVKGIAGSAIAEIPELTLDSSDDIEK